MKRIYQVSTTILAAAMTLAIASPATAVVINIDAVNPAGTTVMLSAGTYRIQYAGIAGGGTYDGFSYWPANVGCDGNGANCARGWVDHYAIDFGGGSGTFNRTDGVGYGLAGSPGFRPVWDTPARALLEYSTRTLQSQTLATINGNANYFMAGLGTYTDVIGQVSFTLSNAQSVNFFVIDNPYTDNRGGVSLDVARVPEPASWALMIAGFGLVGGALRTSARRRGVWPA
jgi:PEP-CTERM motif